MDELELSYKEIATLIDSSVGSEDRASVLHVPEMHRKKQPNVQIIKDSADSIEIGPSAKSAAVTEKTQASSEPSSVPNRIKDSFENTATKENYSSDSTMSEEEKESRETNNLDRE